MDVIGFILAGGSSTRFVRDKKGESIKKQFVQYHDKPLLVHAIENALRISQRVIVLTKKLDTEATQQLIEAYFPWRKVEVLVDKDNEKGYGPLHAIHDAIQHIRPNLAIFIPVDTPTLHYQDLFVLLDEVRTNTQSKKSVIASLVDNKGFISSTVFAINPSLHEIRTRKFQFFLDLKKQLGLALRITDIFLTASRVTLFRVDKLPTNINTREELRRSLIRGEENKEPYLIGDLERRTKKIVNPFVRNFWEHIDTEENLIQKIDMLISFLEASYSLWEGTMGYKQYKKDLEALKSWRKSINEL